VTFGFLFLALLARPFNGGTITGTLQADSTRQPLPFANVALLVQPGNAITTGTVTDASGAFILTGVPNGRYRLRCSMMGYRDRRTIEFRIDSLHPRFEAGIIRMRDTTLLYNEVEVTAEKMLLNSAVDRKVYNVQQDILSGSGTVTDLLQNVPSVQVDVDGTVSLRGSSGVQILINGRTSPLLAAGTPDVLEQIPASSVERIEVITNPSARFTPEGTSGLINIVLKKEASIGLNGAVGANVGTAGRYNFNANANYKPGALNLYGSYNFRQDERSSWTNDDRRQLDASTGLMNSFSQRGRMFARPYSHFLNLGFDYALADAETFGLSATYRRRAYTSTDTTRYLLTDPLGNVTSSYDRRRIDYDKTPVFSGTAFYQNDFVKEDNTLRVELTASHSFDEEDNRYTSIYRVPSGLSAYDNRRIREFDNRQELAVDYHLKLPDESVIETGYAGRLNHADFPFNGSYYDPAASAFVNDATMTNDFIYTESIHAVYGTYQRAIGNLRAMAGLRIEHASIISDLVTLDTTATTRYLRFYPTLHLAQKLNDFNEIQLNYSLRVDRPEADDLNPFPESQNPRSLRAGNPFLKPEYIHSVELGVQFQNEAVSVVPAVFYRNRFNGFTTVTKALNDSTLLTTQENLAKDQSGGFEVVVTGKLWGVISTNLSASGFYEQIDARNLGYGEKKSAFSWNSSLNFNFNVREGTMFQVNGHFHSSHLTPQGKILPHGMLNLGLRQEILPQKLTLVGTVSDLFSSMRRKSEIDTPWLIDRADMFRDSRIFYIGLTFRFGAPPKQAEENPMQYEENG
jgi:outer membrane receptor protein involved in Fe transport